MRAFVTGGTGFIGRQLIDALVDRGDEVVVLSRDPGRAPDALRAHSQGSLELLEGDPTLEGAWRERLAGCDAVVHLAGAPIADRRWNARRRQILSGSRVDSAINLVAAMRALPTGERPSVFVSASGIDYYPFEVDIDELPDIVDDTWIDEDDPAGDHFLARMCREWEREVSAAQELGARVVCLRTGLVLARRGGALPAMEKIFKLLLGGRLGSGRQWVSWVHVRDVVGAYLFALDADELRGGVNLVAPNPVRNRELARSLGAAIGRPSIMATPGFALRMAVGEVAEYLLHGRRARPTRLLESGYEFAFANLADALNDLYP